MSLPDAIAQKPTPLIPADSGGSNQGSTRSTEGEANADDSLDDGDDKDETEPNRANDPYSNLDSAFGNYLADAPRPMTGRRNNDDDDLLF